MKFRYERHIFYLFLPISRIFVKAAQSSFKRRGKAPLGESKRRTETRCEKYNKKSQYFILAFWESVCYDIEKLILIRGIGCKSRTVAPL